MGTKNFQMSKLGLEKEDEQTANICWIIEKAREFQKNIYLCFIDYTKKPLTVWIMTNCGKLLRREYQTILLSPEKPLCGSRSNS